MNTSDNGNMCTLSDSEDDRIEALVRRGRGAALEHEVSTSEVSEYLSE